MRTQPFFNALTAAGGLWLATLSAMSGQSDAPVADPATAPLASEIRPVAILTAMERVADWQLAHPSTHKPTDWTQGALYTGIMALGGISADPKYLDAMVKMGESNQWQLGARKFHADDHCVGQTYVELWLRTHENRMLGPMRARFDDILANPSTTKSLEFSQPKGKASELWSWCDSLFMAPPAWLRLYVATGDRRYLDFMLANWWQTSDYLYDKEEHLYFRDSNYFTKREANGKKVFWSRGNGWVMGGLVRVLQYLPDNTPMRERFVEQFKQMADKILACQRDDGLWRSSLLDPASYPLKETSGSGFFTYALAWGINQGLLDRAKFESAVIKAWKSLVGCVAPDGKLTHVQPIGADPKKFDDNATETYGVGAFLLAGSEVYRLAVLQQAPSAKVSVSNPIELFRLSATTELSWGNVKTNLPGTAKVAVMSGVSSRILDSQVLDLDGNREPDSLLFQVDLAPKETRQYVLVPASALAAVPPPVTKTFARFVPERMDDFAWESDRIAHRMYGQALIKGEGTISSGIDVWVKSVRHPVIDKWYKTGQYHADHGEGLDNYKVGPARGCGGIGIWDGGKLYVSSNFKNWRVLANGPIRSVFDLTYDAWDAAGQSVTETKRISIDAGSNLSRIESMFRSAKPGPLGVGVGIVERKEPGQLEKNEAEGWMSYWEPEMAPNGSIACAVVLPAGKFSGFAKADGNFLALSSAEPEKPFAYYAGAGWSKSGDFPDAKAWMQYVRDFALCWKSPLLITIGAR